MCRSEMRVRGALNCVPLLAAKDAVSPPSSALLASPGVAIVLLRAVLRWFGIRIRAPQAVAHIRCSLGALLLIACTLTGCVQEMADQPRYDPLEQNPAFTEHVLGQTPVRGTVARGQLQLDEPFFSGKSNGLFVSELPEEALAGRTLAEVLQHGRERYTVYCSHCHGQVGGGTGGNPEYVDAVGMVVQRGFPTPPTYHQDRLRQAPLGQFFDVITNGTGRMPPHGYLVPPTDRWAIVAYIRALQLSQHAPRNELSPTDLERLAENPRTSAAE